MSVDSHILAMRTVFDPELAGDLAVRLELRLGEDVFRAEVSDGRLDIVRGSARDADAAIVAADAHALGAMLFQGRPLADAVRAGDVEVRGDRRAVERFLRLFPLPEPAAAA